jgi:hypothetical protein
MFSWPCKITVFWIIAPCRLAGGYRRFGGTRCPTASGCGLKSLLTCDYPCFVRICCLLTQGGIQFWCSLLSFRRNLLLPWRRIQPKHKHLPTRVQDVASRKDITHNSAVVSTLTLHAYWELSASDKAGIILLSAVGIATGNGLDGRGVRVRLSTSSGPVLGPTWPVVNWGSFSGGQSCRDVKLTTYLQLVPRWRIHGFIRPFPHTPQ